jgi:hypothetical protein
VTTKTVTQTEWVYCERLKLASDVILQHLAEETNREDGSHDGLEVELTIFREQIEHKMLSPLHS